MKEVILNLPFSDSKIVDSSVGKVERKYNIIFCRAFGSLSKIAKEGRKYLRRGKIIAYKGKRVNIDREIHELRQEYKKKIELINIKVPFLEEERHIVIVNYG